MRNFTHFAFACFIVIAAAASNSSARVDTPPHSISTSSYFSTLEQVRDVNKDWLAERKQLYSYVCSYEVEHFGRLGEPIVSYEAKHPYTRAISMDSTLEWLIYQPVTPYRIVDNDDSLIFCYKSLKFPSLSFIPTSLSLWHWSTDNRPVADENHATILVFVNKTGFNIEHMLSLYPSYTHDHNIINGKYKGGQLYDYIYADDGKLVKVVVSTQKSDRTLSFDIDKAKQYDLDSFVKYGDYRPLATYNVRWIGDVAYFDSVYIHLKSGPVLRTKITNYSLEPLVYSTPGQMSITSYEDYAYNPDIKL